jgi:NAD(P)-dependent dehydrogenase (short-subunit alcohol dehydrogenase family)
MTRPTPPTILVTGATGGLGYETARLLANAVGATVVVHGPTQDSALNARNRLIREGVSPAQVQAVAADFTRLSEVGQILSAERHIRRSRRTPSPSSR